MFTCEWFAENVWTARGFTALLFIILTFLLDLVPSINAWWKPRVSIVKFGILMGVSIAFQAAAYFLIPWMFGCAVPSISALLNLLVEAAGVVAVAVGLHEARKK